MAGGAQALSFRTRCLLASRAPDAAETGRDLLATWKPKELPRDQRQEERYLLDNAYIPFCSHNSLAQS